MNILSLFDGISCGRVALERVGIKVDKYYASEIDESAIKISEKNYPDIIHLGDVTKWKEWDIDLNSIDLLIGGSPCQDLSIAKQNREGLSGARSGLFFNYLDILKTINPKYFLLENNASMSEENKQKISELIGVEPILIDSSSFSAQIRKRLYWTNIPISKIPEVSNTVIKDIQYFDSSRKVYSFEKYKETIKVSSDGTLIKWDTSGKGYYSQQSRARVNTIKMNTLPASGTDKNNIYIGDYKYYKVHPLEAERLQTLPDNYTEGVSNAKRISLCGNGWTVDVIAHIFKGLNNE